MYELYLKNALAQETLPHALLFIGPGGEAPAKQLAATLLQCEEPQLSNHPDFQAFHPEGKSGHHAIESIRELTSRVYTSPSKASRKVFLLHSADRMQPAAANALLKTLEEPLLDTTLILLADDARPLLPTIRSRCTPLLMNNAEFVTPIDFSKLAEEAARIEREIEVLEDPVMQQRKFDEFLMALLMWVRDGQAAGKGKLFFPGAVNPPLVFVEELEKAIEKARLGYDRNLKVAACLDQVLSVL